MSDFLSFLFSSAFSGSAPLFGAVSSTCRVNGELVACPGWLDSLGVGFGIFGLIYLAVIVLIIVANWKIYTKAGQPGWASIVPIYNIIVLLKIVGKPIWWILLMFIPFVNIIIGIIVTHNLSKAFGKNIGFTIGLMLLPFIFYPILGFGKAIYLGAGQKTPPAAMPSQPTI